ncbi:MAG TPA: hypothetical protein VEA69_09160 [Tepidisphaeraceae bacterium]|nr:hypothetical protein [Tepidisphaeraceae bacterium]
MPWIIDYDVVLETLGRQGLKCNYHNSGAFGFAEPAAGLHALGWVGPADESIRPQVRALTRQVPAPHEQTLARLARQAWQAHLPGRAWVMPMSHWHYELNFGARDWMPALIENVQLDPGLLENRNNGAAIEFAPDEADLFEYFTGRLLEMLLGSDFMIAFPGHPALCTVHHHKQLWWQTTDAGIRDALDSLVNAEK